MSESRLKMESRASAESTLAAGNKRRRVDEADDVKKSSPPQAPRQLSDPAQYPRKRVSVACEVCRLRKTRCDAGKPSCSFCASLGVECTYRKSSGVIQNLMTRAKQGEKYDILQNRLESIENALSSSKIISPPPSEGPVSAVTIGTPRSESLHETSPPKLPIATQAALLPRRVSNSSQSQATPLRRLAEIPEFPIIGMSAAMRRLGQMAGHSFPVQLEGLNYDDSEEYIESEFHQNELLDVSGDPHSLDLSAAKCWSHQQAFVRHVLPWFPLFGSDYAVQLVTLAQDNNFNPRHASTPLALYVLALGAFARADLITNDDVGGFPGLNYFAAARNIAEPGGVAQAIEVVQSQILRTLYLMMCMRPLLASESISSASRSMVVLLHLKRHLNNDLLFASACHRAYWACYIIEKELRPYAAACTPGIEYLHDIIDIPLPLSTHDEPGMLWYLSEIALRRIFSNVAGSESHTTYEPIVSMELHKQLMEWFETLPPGIKFDLDSRPISDQQKAFLRAQYYSVLFVGAWSAVVRLLTMKAQTVHEHNILLADAARCYEYGIMYIQTVECSCLERHVLLFANILGTYAISLMMLCAYGAPELASLSHIDIASAVHGGYRILSTWSANPNVASKVRRLEVLMREKGLSSSDGNSTIKHAPVALMT